MTVGLRSDANGTSGAIQVAGVDRLLLDSAGNLTGTATPAAGDNSKLLPTTEFVQSAIKGRFQKFTASGSFTAPAGVTTVYLSGCGGGAGGGGYASGGAEGGGGGQSTLRQAVTVVPGNVYTVTIGAGGAGGAVGNNGTSGGATSFGALLTLSGGVGGSLNGSGSGNSGGFGGQVGADASGNFGGGGGGTLFGVGGMPLLSTGSNGAGYGAGGAGGYINYGGGSGTAGLLIVEW